MHGVILHHHPSCPPHFHLPYSRINKITVATSYLRSLVYSLFNRQLVELPNILSSFSQYHKHFYKGGGWEEVGIDEVVGSSSFETLTRLNTFNWGLLALQLSWNAPSQQLISLLNCLCWVASESFKDQPSSCGCETGLRRGLSKSMLVMYWCFACILFTNNVMYKHKQNSSC